MDDQATAPEGTPAHEESTVRCLSHRPQRGCSPPCGRLHHQSAPPNAGPRRLCHPPVLSDLLVGGRRFRIPAETGYEASLLQQPSPVVSVLITGVVLAGCVVIGTVIAGGTWFYAGLLAATLGLTALDPRRADALRHLPCPIHRHNTSPLFRPPAGAGVLFAMVAGLWRFLWRKYERVTPLEEIIPENASRTAKDGNGSRNAGTAIAVQIGVMALVLLLLLTQTDVKKQVLVSVFLAGMIGTAVAENFFADRVPAAGTGWVRLPSAPPAIFSPNSSPTAGRPASSPAHFRAALKPSSAWNSPNHCPWTTQALLVRAPYSVTGSMLAILSSRHARCCSEAMALEPIVAAPSDRSTTPSPTHNAGSNGRK